uniref:Unc-59 n=1 Tax=Pristionchus pacificus TaxID=54126 RepID=A0A2A6BKR7_PRIPA|eukprot:PDM66381.1 unc-59 [Pristionchus pacificus]
MRKATVPELVSKFDHEKRPRLVHEYRTRSKDSPLSPLSPVVQEESSEDVTSRTTMSARTEGSRTTSTATAKDTHYVGFANFPNQVFRRAIKNGFEFTLMVVGQSGLGKSTFVNTLFLAEINDPKKIEIPKLSSTTSIEQKHVKLVENGTTLRLSLVDTPGFGDAIDNNKCWEPIVQFIEKRYSDYFTEETKIERKERVPDHCVHLCFYFIAPTGHGLKQLDIECMKRLHEHVNIIPVIAKADCLTKDELVRFKAQIQKDIDANGIKVYKFPESEDEDEKKQLEPLRRRTPFAVVGSNHLREDGGRKYRYREYAWGVVEVDNLAHNDFIALRDMVVRTNLVDLIEVTRNVHYENFRFRQMQGKGGAPGAVQKSGSGDRDPFTQMEEDHHRREKEFMAKQREMDKLFDDKVADRNKRFAERAARLDARDADLKKAIEERKTEIDRMMNESDGSSTAPRVSRANSKVSELSLHNENGGLKLSPPGGEKPGKVKKSALGIFTRNS